MYLDLEKYKIYKFCMKARLVHYETVPILFFNNEDLRFIL